MLKMPLSRHNKQPFSQIYAIQVNAFVRKAFHSTVIVRVFCFTVFLCDCARTCVFVFVDTEMLYFMVFLLKYILKIKQLKFSVIVFNLQYRRVFAILLRILKTMYPHFLQNGI